MKRTALILLAFLPTILSAQSFIKQTDGKYFEGEIKSQNDSAVVIKGKDMGDFSINKRDIAFIEFQESGLLYFNKSGIKEIKGSGETVRGSSAFVPISSDNIAERYGKRKMKELLKKEGFWKVADCDLEADFIINYVFDDKGRDHAYFEIKARDGSLIFRSSSVGARDFVPGDAGEESAQKLYKKYIVKYQKKTEEIRMK